MENKSIKRAQETADRLVTNVEKVVVGNHVAVQLVGMALLCRGHVLIEGVPGVGKTMFARSLALSVNGSFKRIQCTSDLLPSDITGTYVFDQRDRDFYFRPGPVMAHLVLVDEINRAPPKTQSAFLECMEEHQVTVDGVTHPLPQPFLLMCTRNPIHHSGTFPLPETELDRFLLRVRLDYPSSEEEAAIVERQLTVHPIDGLEQVVGLEDVLQAQEALKEVYVDRLVTDYVVEIVRATRNHPSINMGASPRSTIALVSLARALALLQGRDFTTPDDVKAIAVAGLAHRLTLTTQGRDGSNEDEIIQEILESIPVDGRSRSGTPPVVASAGGGDPIQ